MSGGYVGTVLEVDLTNKKINKLPLNPQEAEMFIGGRDWAPNGCGTVPVPVGVTWTRIHP